MKRGARGARVLLIVGACLAQTASAPLRGVAAEPASVCSAAAAQAVKPQAPPMTPPARPMMAISPTADALDLVLLGDERMSRLQLRVVIDRHALATRWDETELFDRLLGFYDYDQDGRLNAGEVRRLPSAFGLRQPLWRPMAPLAGPAPELAAIDVSGDGHVTRDELADFYRRAGLGNVLVGSGRPPATAALTAAIEKQLDADGDQRLTEAEFRAADRVLMQLDRNDDELVGPGELVPNTNYPGAMGSVLLSTTGTPGASQNEADALPLVSLPPRTADTRWAAALVARRDRNADEHLDAAETGWTADALAALDQDKDSRVSANELAVWRNSDADVRITVRLGARDEGQPRIECSSSLADPPEHDTRVIQQGALRLQVRADEGKSTQAIGEARTRLRNRFSEADTNRDGHVEKEEAIRPALGEIRQLLELADRDADARLSEAEFTLWLDLQESLAQAQVLLTVLDHGSGLFEFLDANQDGALSIRELRTSWARLIAGKCVTDDRLDLAKLPRQLIATVSHGHPQRTLPTPTRDGPSWFVAMDRNGDGDVSAREFLGVAADFARLDTDGDRQLSAAEATTVADTAPAGGSR